MPLALKDRFGRTVNNLRVSVTDRCNFRCRYCMPENGMHWLDRADLLTYEEITRIVRILAPLGVEKIRLTGGEPLMRKNLNHLVSQLRPIPGIRDIAVTTNGYFLAEQADGLVKAGVDRFNVSMDSLDAAIFSQMVRREYFQRVQEGLEALERLPLGPVKINVVLLRGINDGEIVEFVHLARTKPFVIRFIEFMPIGAEDGWTIDKVVTTREVIERIEALGTPLLPIEGHGVQPSDRYRFADGIGEIGFISSVSEPFCSSCNRIRITSDGKLRTCLFSLDETDLRALLRDGASDDTIGRRIIDAVWGKEEGHLINRPGFVRPERTMSRIGG